MAPDRGRSLDGEGLPPPLSSSPPDTLSHDPDDEDEDEDEEDDAFPPTSSMSPSTSLDPKTVSSDFTIRSLTVGLLVGIIICFSNMYFGLQTGWVSSMSMPASLIGFAVFKTLSRHLRRPFSARENVLVQTVAGAVGTMPLGSGFVGVVPAIEFLLKDDEKGEGGNDMTAMAKGDEKMSLWRLMIWSLGVCFFGVFFAVPLRKEYIIRQKLKFPSGTATALMIGVLHGEDGIGDEKAKKSTREAGGLRRRRSAAIGEESLGLLDSARSEDDGQPAPPSSPSRRPSLSISELARGPPDARNAWRSQTRLLLISFSISGVFTLLASLFPSLRLRHLPVFGTYLAKQYLWTLNPSPAYIGQGIIMGPATTSHMLLGALVGWGVLSPLAKWKGWAPGEVGDWETGGKGWIVWVSLSIMLADAGVNLGWLVLRPVVQNGAGWVRGLKRWTRRKGWAMGKGNYMAIGRSSSPSPESSPSPPPPPLLSESSSTEHHRLSTSLSRTTSMTTTPHLQRSTSSSPLVTQRSPVPTSHAIPTTITLIGLALSLLLCLITTPLAFPSTLTPLLTTLALLLALLLSLISIRALGETDLNPVSGISKITQLVFALPLLLGSGMPRFRRIQINLLAGAVSEAGALQAGDMLQDLKTGHLLGASPRAQFLGQVLGSAVGAIVAAAVYRLYTNIYPIPGDAFPVPTGYVWIFTARLVTGSGLPPKVADFAVVAFILFTLVTIMRVALPRWSNTSSHTFGLRSLLLPSGIAVAVGMYNTPSFTLARFVGGMLSWWWARRMGGHGGKSDGEEGEGDEEDGNRSDTPIIILASGLILGEGVVSILDLVLVGLGWGGVG
ncbi:MAG: hypothetical protein M1817_001936 [Caeruleum heppii]|nr:MAG: hypothetical protein M1817_001936 [Caeruleum heppii]